MKSSEVIVKGNNCDILENFFEIMSRNGKILEDENSWQFEDYGDKIQEGRMKHNKKKLSHLRKSEKLQTFNLKSVMMNYDGKSSYLSGMRDDKAVYPKIEKL